METNFELITHIFGIDKITKLSEEVFSVKINANVIYFCYQKGIISKISSSNMIHENKIIFLHSPANHSKTVSDEFTGIKLKGQYYIEYHHYCYGTTHFMIQNGQNVFCKETIFTGISMPFPFSSSKMTSIDHLNIILSKQWDCIKKVLLKKCMILIEAKVCQDILVPIIRIMYLLGHY